MRFKSTRSASIRCSFEDAIFSGYAPDGGLFVPEYIPRVDRTTLKKWAKLNFQDLAAEVLSMFVSDDIPDCDLREVCQKSFTGFEVDGVVPVSPLSDSVFVAELFHGPTFCFKDIGLRILINFFAYFAEKRKQKITLLVATTGDTGPAAVKAVGDSGSEFLSIVVHFPSRQISTFQRKQLTTVNSKRVKIVEYEGGGDDMDAPIKRITGASSRSALNERLVCGINSFNIGRPLAQMTHFIWTYLRVVDALRVEPGDSKFVLDIVVPTGAMGNLAGGYMAKHMGIPFGFFTAGVNDNDVTDIVFRSGSIHKAKGPMKETLSEAINIQLPYNLERILFYVTGGQHEIIRSWYSALDEERTVELGSWLQVLQQEFRSARIPDKILCQTLVEIKGRFGYLMDPHTGVAFAAAKEWGYLNHVASGSSKVVAIMATASPCKFEFAISRALGVETWKEYERTSFPKRGLSILVKDEFPPQMYHASNDKLEENQRTWESACRQIINGF